MLVIELFRRQMVAPEAAIFDVMAQLVRVRCPSAYLRSIRPTESSEWTDTRPPFVMDDLVGIRIVSRLAVRIHEVRQAEPAGEIDQDVLKGTDIAIRLQHRHTDRIGRPMG
jgi:hypothetical protein